MYNHLSLRILCILIFLNFGSTGFALNGEVEEDIVPGEFVIQFKGVQAAQMDLLRLENLLGGKILEKIPESTIFLLKREPLENPDLAMKYLMDLPMIDTVEPNYIYKMNMVPNDPKLSELWGLKNSGQMDSKKNIGIAGVDIGITRAWDITTGSSHVIVGVIDSGINYNHPDLKANMWKNLAELNGKPGVDDDKNGYVDDIYGYDFANNDADPMDDNGHGSHVSGTIGAKGDDGIGLVGVNWKVKLMALKFLSSKGSGSLYSAIAAINYASKMGVQVLSNSWGGGGASKLLKKAITNANAKNIVFVAAAGNESNNNDLSPTYPANYDVTNVISVAAIDNRGSLASFSCYGKKTVHVAAPGVNILSSIIKGYASYSGTSMATPHVSGIVALLLAQNKKLTPLAIKNRLIKTSRSSSSLKGKVAANGFVDAYYALTNQVPTSKTDESDSSVGVSDEEGAQRESF